MAKTLDEFRYSECVIHEIKTLMSKIDELFAKLKTENATAFMPFITAGDPDMETTARLLSELDATGCHLVELGIPYSDPIADGPVIQASYTRALGSGTKLNAIFDMVSRVAPTIEMPIVMMVSYAIIYRVGVDDFLKKAVAAGVSGAIVPDMPVDEADEFSARCKEHDFSLNLLITPTTTRERAVRIAAATTGFIYYVSIAGITGERTGLPDDLVDNLTWLRSQTELPICVGFGISEPDQVKMLKPVADGIIVGSAIVRRIAAASEGSSAEDVIAEVKSYAGTMVAAAGQN